MLSPENCELYPLLLRSVLCTFGWGEGQAGGLAHHSTLLIGEHPFESFGVDEGFALVRGHRSQIPNRGAYHALTIRGKLSHLAENLARLLFLFGRQMLPGFHPV